MCLNYFKGRETFKKNIVRPVNGKCYFTYAVIRKFLCPQHSRPTKKKKKKKEYITTFSGDIQVYEQFKRTVYPEGQFNIPINLDLRLFPLHTTNTVFLEASDL